MSLIHFDPETDLAPMPFDRRICEKALEMKQRGLAWRPHVGCFVWDPDEFISANSPFPERVYFILSMRRFVDIFGSVEQMVEKLVWTPTRHQALLLCQGHIEAVFTTPQLAEDPVQEMLSIYESIIRSHLNGN